MRKKIARALDEAAQNTAKLFSNPDRPQNHNKETFTVDKITPLSEYTACVVFRKDTGKFGAAFYYWVNANGGEWRYFFPTDSHLLGMGLMCQAKQLIEFANYGFNL